MCGWLEQLRIRLSQLPTKLKLKLKLSMAITVLSYDQKVYTLPEKVTLQKDTGGKCFKQSMAIKILIDSFDEETYDTCFMRLAIQNLQSEI